MKNILLAVVGLMLSIVLAGCVIVDKAISPIGTAISLKQNGCDALSDTDRQLMLLVIKSSYPGYPDNGICDPLLINTLLSSELEKLQAVEND